MVKLKYNLDEIKTAAYDTGRCRAKLKKITKKDSRAGKPMLVFQWSILTGPNKGKKISSYPSLQADALGNLKEHLEALGESGKINKSSDSLLGRVVVLVIGESPSRDGGRPYVGITQVLPKSSPLTEVDEDEEDEEEEEEDEDDDEDYDEDDYDDEDEDDYDDD